MAMTIESIRDWHRKQARAKDVCGELRFPGPNESPFYRIPSEESKQHDAMADALDAHLPQPAQAVDVLSAEDFAVLLRLRNALPDVGLNGWHRGVAVLNKLLTAALPNANGKEG